MGTTNVAVQIGGRSSRGSWSGDAYSDISAVNRRYALDNKAENPRHRKSTPKCVPYELRQFECTPCKVDYALKFLIAFLIVYKVFGINLFGVLFGVFRHTKNN